MTVAPGVAKAAVRARKTGGVGRGRGVEVLDLDPEVPSEGLPEVMTVPERLYCHFPYNGNVFLFF